MANTYSKIFVLVHLVFKNFFFDLVVNCLIGVLHTKLVRLTYQ